MECYEKGIFTQEELDGIDFKWGATGRDPRHDGKALRLRRHLGVPLQLASRGCARAAGKGEECCVTANGIEIRCTAAA
jgi:hypothetical protein